MTREVQEEDLLTPEEWQAARRLAALRLKRIRNSVEQTANAREVGHMNQYGLNNNLNQKGADLAESLVKILLRLRLSDERLGPADLPDDQWADPKVP